MLKIVADNLHDNQTMGSHFDQPGTFSDEKQQVPKPYALLQAVPIFQQPYLLPVQQEADHHLNSECNKLDTDKVRIMLRLINR